MNLSSPSKFSAPLKAASVTLLTFVKSLNEQSLVKRIAFLFHGQKELHKAIRLIQKHHSILKQLKKGSQEDQDLAYLIEKAVNEYNGAASKTKNRLRSAPLYITFPSIRHHHEGTPFNKTSTLLDPRQMDLFWMKMVRVMNTSRTHLSSVELSKNELNSGERTFEPLPGEVVSFRYNPANPGVNYWIDSQQSGFPDPALLGGMTCPESFLPQVVSEKFPSWIAFLKLKGRLAEDLLPKGKFNQKAKNLYLLQKELFQDVSPLITLHVNFLKKLVSHLKIDVSIGSYDELSALYRTVNQAVDSINEYIEVAKLDDTYSKEDLNRQIQEKNESLPSHFSKELFSHFLKKPLVELATFQQLYFCKLLHMELNPKTFLNQIENYFQILTQIAHRD